jgi:hypothetical protein
MTFLADFNLEDERGRIPVLLSSGVSIHVGETVLVADREGNRCKAVVADVSSRLENGVERLVAYVVPKPGTWEQTR